MICLYAGLIEEVAGGSANFLALNGVGDAVDRGLILCYKMAHHHDLHDLQKQEQNEDQNNIFAHLHCVMSFDYY